MPIVGQCFSHFLGFKPTLLKNNSPNVTSPYLAAIYVVVIVVALIIFADNAELQLQLKSEQVLAQVSDLSQIVAAADHHLAGVEQPQEGPHDSQGDIRHLKD